MLSGTVILVLFVLIAILAPVLAPNESLEVLTTKENKILSNLPPSSSFWLGTTPLGQDILSQLILGSRSAIVVGISAAALVITIGSLIGLFSGFYGGRIDNLLMWITDIAFGIPFLPLIILLAAYLGSSTSNIILAVGFLLWRDAARPIRSEVLKFREQEFVQAAKVAGASYRRIIFLHIAPNIFPLVALYASISMGWAILAEATVSFLGLSSSSTVSWGYMLHEAFQSQAMSKGQFWWFVPPGVAISLLVFAVFGIGRSIEERLIPTLRKK
jgi:peptide/nickel transport system permease protein